MSKWVSAILILVTLGACRESEEKPVMTFTERGVAVPEFSSDSAFSFIEAQVAFGPRVPGTYGHKQTYEFLTNKLSDLAGREMVFSQQFTATGYEGSEMNLKNIIASFNPSASDRIMLCAHWDTRPRADEDTSRTTEYISGADDGGSGVGVLLEMARIFSEDAPPVGVDIILFDGEDYGVKGDLDNYFLGSRYWSQNPPVPGYRPRFGILLDMVGAQDAVFPKELYSKGFAPGLVNEVWSIASMKGYGNYFIDEKGGAVLDDHYVVQQYTGIPVINIIHHTSEDGQYAQFGNHWHTHRDSLDIIDTKTLQAVGEVLTELIYNRL